MTPVPWLCWTIASCTATGSTAHVRWVPNVAASPSPPLSHMVANNRPILSVGDAVMYKGELARVEQVHPTACVIRELKSGWIVTVAHCDLTLAPGWDTARAQNP